MNVREYALNVLVKVLYDHGYANLLMRQENDLNEADQALASELVYGTLRNVTLLDYQWRDLAEHCDRRTSVLLDLSVYQLQHLDRIPDYAVINEAVLLASRHDKNFVNAILHKVLKRGKKELHLEDPLEQAAMMTSHPLWLLKLWSAHYGTETAIKIAEQDQQRPQVYGRINTLKISKETLAKEEGITFLNDVSFICDQPIAKTAYFEAGAMVVQDLSSAEIPMLMDLKAGMKVLDVCAAPGTKTQEMAMLMENQGEIVANDLYQERIALIDQLMQKTGTVIVNSIARDASLPDDSLQLESFDRILVDAPCSGLGDLSHKPEIRLHVTPDSLDELVKLQTQILNANAPYLKKGGILVYSTCTLNRKENESQTKKFLQTHPDFELLEEHTVFPFEKDTDGFYAAKFHRSAGLC